MNKVYILIGLPASGKSTWAQEMANKEAFTIINNDNIRDQFSDNAYSLGTLKWDQKFEKKVIEESYHQIKNALLRHENVIIDNTHLNPKTLKKLVTFLKFISDQYNLSLDIKYQNFDDISVNTCIRRDAERKKLGQRSVGSDVIVDMWVKYILPDIPKLPKNPKLMNAIIVDLDGTLAIVHNRNIYDATHCDEDLPCEAVLDLVKTYKNKFGYNIFFVSGRKEKYRDPTLLFLKHCGINLTSGDWTHKLYMRTTDDERDDTIIKREIYQKYIFGKYNVIFVVDDRPKVVRMWKEQGLTVFNVGHSVEF